MRKCPQRVNVLSSFSHTTQLYNCTSKILYLIFLRAQGFIGIAAKKVLEEMKLSEEDLEEK